MEGTNNIFKYNPKYDFVRGKSKRDFKFDYGVKGVPLEKQQV